MSATPVNIAPLPDALFRFLEFIVPVLSLAFITMK
jgi:hypothetical protein